MEHLDSIGTAVKDLVLALAGLLREDASPGGVVVLLIIGLASALLHLFITVRQRTDALRWLRAVLGEASDDADFTRRIESLDRRVKEEVRPGARTDAATAWGKYRETFVAHEQDGGVILRNAVRPSTFFNVEDLHFGPGFWRIIPGLFVTIGLFLTFLGLIAALDTMQGQLSDTEAAMKQLLSVASAKFIMSLTGLFCSIIFTIALRFGMGKVEKAIHGLNGDIEDRLTYISLEGLAVEQLAATREQREHFKAIGAELIAELGRPFREEVPQAIAESVRSSVAPLFEQVSQMSSAGVGDMVRDLSSRFSDDVGGVLQDVSDKLDAAGDRIGGLVDRMDQSSGHMGCEMDATVNRLGAAVEELRTTLTSGATETTSAFSRGAEQIVESMHDVLQGIKDNTADGARAMSAAAADMSKAAGGIRSELEEAANASARAAQERMHATGSEVSEAIGAAGLGISEAFGKTGAEIARIGDEMTEKAGNHLLSPMQDIAGQLSEVSNALKRGTVEMRRASDAVGAGARAASDASDSFGRSAASLVDATDPVRSMVEGLQHSTQDLQDSTRRISETSYDSLASMKQILTAAQEAIGGERQAMEASLSGLRQVLEKLREQGDRLDDIDEKLGQAFETYRQQVETAVDGLFGHVRSMQEALTPALHLMKEVVEQAEEFAPKTRRR